MATTAFADFARYLGQERRLSQNTIDAYLSDLTIWVRVGAKIQSTVAPDIEEILECALRFDQEAISSATLSRRHAALRSYVSFRALSSSAESAEAQGWRKLHGLLPAVSGDEAFPKALAVDEVARLLDFEVGDEPKLLRNRALLELLYATGLRVSELIHLQWSQVDEQMQLVRVLGKGSKERVVPYSERAADWLARYRTELWPKLIQGATKRNAELVFPSPQKAPLSRMGVWKILRQRGLQVGIADLHPHVLRHSLATHLLQGGADIRFVQILLGHSSLNATERYIRLSDDEVKKMFEDFHPLEPH